MTRRAKPRDQEPAISVTLKMKLGSLVVHVEEALSEFDQLPLFEKAGSAVGFDLAAMRGLVQDAEVQEFVKAIPPVMLPRKRNP
jgi:hypothetical protein